MTKPDHIRVAFEEWAREKYNLTKSANGEYYSWLADQVWHVWQAAWKAHWRLF